MAKRILTAWIGHADLRAFAPALPAKTQEELFRIVRRQPADAIGPLKSLLRTESFAEVHLLSTYEAKWDRPFSIWLGIKPKIHHVTLPSPTDYAAIFDSANGVLEKVRGRLDGGQLCIHLSPGTPAMTAVWVLLGKTRFPAIFYQSFKGTAWETEIPFEITVDFLPELLKLPDAHLQHLAAKSPGEVEGFEDIIGDSRSIRFAVGRARRAAVRDVPVLILGESGTGKELFARAIHNASHRRNKNLVAINCAAIPKELLESELFGYAKGAFTDAKKDKPGAFRRADGGTLFLDEIGDCDPAMQAKLLRVMQPPPDGGPCDRVFTPVGGQEETSNVRIIAATNKDLVQSVTAGVFREDLYYRLAVISIDLPPLHARRADIPGIAAGLQDRINQDFKQLDKTYEDKYLSSGAKTFVRQYDWPGNVRQLHNALLQASTMSEGTMIEKVDLLARPDMEWLQP